jgi:hypothetical protein
MMVMFRALRGMSQGSAGGVTKYCVTSPVPWYVSQECFSFVEDDIITTVLQNYNRDYVHIQMFFFQVMWNDAPESPISIHIFKSFSSKSCGTMHLPLSHI